MTLLLKAITDKYAFSISDRLLTKQTSSSFIPFDQVSNKTVVFFPRNGIISISYTGTAYIGKIPTDRWIAEKLSGYDLSEGKDFFIHNNDKEWPHLYNSVENLIRELNREWPSLPIYQRDPDLGLLICGWQKTKSRPYWRPVMWGLDGKGTSESPFFINRRPRFYPERYVVTMASGVKITDEENDQLTKSILHERKNGSEKTVERAIVNELRKKAKNHPTIGLDCMAIRMTWNHKPEVTITYHSNPDLNNPLPPLKAPVESRSGLIIGFGKPEEILTKPPEIESLGSYYSPYIISRYIISPPSSVLGTLNLKIRDMTVLINGPSPPAGIIGGFISQKRRKKP